MAPSIVHLPDGQCFNVSPVFSGLFFRSVEHDDRHTRFPPGWTIVLHSEDGGSDLINGMSGLQTTYNSDGTADSEPKKTHVHKFREPTLQNDTIFISSILNPSSGDYKPASSPSRHIALMLWISLYWYFQQPQPSPYLETMASQNTPQDAKPQGEWRIRIKRDGIFRSRNMIPKLERMGLISTLDSAVGTSTVENAEGWDSMYVTRQSFWQIPSGLFLFTLQPQRLGGSHPGSPIGSRPTSPSRNESTAPSRASHTPTLSAGSILLDAPMSADIPARTLTPQPSFPIGPYWSASHLPTYFPPPPLQYRMTNGVRHPLRNKPPRMGEIFYTRFVPSVGKYLSFRVASASSKPVPSLGPTSQQNKDHLHLSMLSDTSLLQMWLSNPRVSKFWGEYHPTFLTNALKSKHSFPAIGLWDGVPFGYFEIYWVKEDILGALVGRDVEDWDRGLHVLVGEEWARGKVPTWLSSLVHWCFQADNRTMNVCLEPRVDNERFIGHLEEGGFSRDRQVAFQHKQAWLFRLRREAWKGPAL